MIRPLRDLGRAYTLLWLSETAFQAGSAIAVFALGAWVYRRSGSLLGLSGTMVAATLPSLLVLPLAGTLADRVDRRKIMIVSDAVALACAGILFAAILEGVLTAWLAYAFIASTAIANTCKSPAYRAAVNGLLRADDVARANGLAGISAGVIGIAAPMMGGAVMAACGLEGIVTCHVAALCASLVLALLAFAAGSRLALSPSPSPSQSPAARGKAAWRHTASDFRGAITYLRSERWMGLLLAYATIEGFLVDLVSTLLAPLILASHSVRDLGAVLTFGGLGTLLGACPLFLPSVSRRLAAVLIVADAVLSACALAAGLGSSFMLYAACAFVGGFAGGIASGCMNALWMLKVPLARQGSVFAVTASIATASPPAVALLAGLIVDRILEPALSRGGFGAGVIGAWLGSDKARGASLLFVACGLVGLAMSLGALFHKGIRNIDNLVPDGR